VTSSITGTSNTILVGTVTATHFSVGAPASATAGLSFTFTVTALDQFNNPATGYSGTVHFTSSDSSAALPADSTLTNGTGSFSATLRTAGSQTITATDTSTSTITGSATVVVNAATAAFLVVAGYPSPVTAGTANSFTVTAKDAFGNRATGYAGTVHFTSSDPKAVLPANYRFMGSDAGMHMFSVTLRTATPTGQSITATDTVTSSISGTQMGIVVNPAPTNHLVVSRFPSKTTAGVAQSFRITAQDMFGNTTPGFSDTVSFSSSDGKALLPGNQMFTSPNPGYQDFSGTLVTAGTQSITVKDITNASVASGTQSGIVVNPAAASHLLVSGFPSSVIVGTAHNFTVTALDAYGNVATGYLGTVKFMSSDPIAMLPANYTFTSGDAGMHTMFSATLNTPGTQSITATDTVNSSITGMEGGISVVTSQPTATVSGPTTAVPGQPLTYTLNASESGPFAGPPYSYQVNWGDGSAMQLFQSSNTSATVMVPHTFVTTGTYTITVTAKDPSGNASMPAMLSVSISAVAMETDPYNSSQTALYVGGTLGDDNIAITPTPDGGGVKVGMNMVSYGSFYPTGHVVVYGQSGNDIIKTAAQANSKVPALQAVTLNYVSVPLLIFAGNGNDILNVSGSSVGNVLVAGGGNDRLIGGQGRDILIGGAGTSTLQAGNPPATNLAQGGAILIGGTTDYDGNAQVLAGFLAEWSRTDIDYATRIAHLTGAMSGGLNGTNLLKGSMTHNSTDTVHDNGQGDTLTGGTGMDWYFAGMLDMFVNRTSDETVNPIS
jgi:hypothetical protein